MSAHTHCQNCFKVKCKIFRESQDACEMVECSCGRNFHGCKIQDHMELCDKVKVSCINQAFGCEVMVRREDMNSHLKTCPANIVPEALRQQMPSVEESRLEQEDDMPLPQNGLSIEHLPTELLIKIFNYLSPCTLSRLYLVNKTFHQVVSSLLVRKGSVSLIWKKEGSSWRIEGKKWFLSNIIGRYRRGQIQVIPDRVSV